MRTLGGLYELEERVFGMMGHERMKQLLDAVALFNTVFEKEVDNERQN
ncbi:unknown [Firmicutes bacterium CAG:555]|nr:unknown [Firmicutes bacterium CAG:555]